MEWLVWPIHQSKGVKMKRSVLTDQQWRQYSIYENDLLYVTHKRQIGVLIIDWVDNPSIQWGTQLNWTY